MVTVAEGSEVTLLGGAKLRCAGDDVRLPVAAHRLLSFLAFQECPVQRQAVAEALWPVHRAGRAAANLRSALWHARRIRGTAVIDSVGGRLCLADAVRVDIHDLTRRAHQIITSPSSEVDLTGYGEVVELFSRELLPDWSDEWLMIERERWDQVRLHALETLAQRLLDAEQHLPALETALTAVAIEPMRESAHRAVIEIHIAEGNAACALKHYRYYRGLVQRELGVPPTQRMEGLIRGLGR